MGLAAEPNDAWRTREEGTKGKIQCQPLRRTRCPIARRLRAETWAPAREVGIAEPVTSPTARANAKRTEESALHPGKRRFSQFPRHEEL